MTKNQHPGTLIKQSYKRRSFCKTDSLAIRPCFRMHILTLGIIVGIFTFVKSTPLPTDPDSDSDSDSIQIVPNPDPNSYIDSQNSVQILPQDPIDSQDQQPNFLPDGVTGHEIISQTPGTSNF